MVRLDIFLPAYNDHTGIFTVTVINFYLSPRVRVEAAVVNARRCSGTRRKWLWS